MTTISTHPRPLTDTETIRYANNRNNALAIVRSKVFATITPYYLRPYDKTPQGYTVQINGKHCHLNGSVDRAMTYIEDLARKEVAA